MSKKPEIVGAGRRVCTQEEIAEVLDGFEEEMLADLYRRRAKAKVLEFPSEQGLDRQREVLAGAERRLIEEEKRWIEEARKHNRVWIEERRRMGEYHAGRKQAHMEAEYWAKQKMDRGNYDPIKLFVTEIKKEMGDE